MNTKINHNRRYLREKIEKILIQLLYGHNDICHKIIELKYDYEMNDIKQEIIDRDFYNWLNNDLIRRSNISHNSYYYNYYLMNSNNLGLIYEEKYNEKGFRRDRSLIKCFESKWWKTTQKNNYEWESIHCRINLIKTMRIWKYPYYFFPGLIFDSFDNFINKNWKDPTISEIKEIFKLIGNDNLSEVYNMYYLCNNFIVYFC